MSLRRVIDPEKILSQTFADLKPQLPARRPFVIKNTNLKLFLRFSVSQLNVFTFNIYGHLAKISIWNLKNCQNFKIHEKFKSVAHT